MATVGTAHRRSVTRGRLLIVLGGQEWGLPHVFQRLTLENDGAQSKM